MITDGALTRDETKEVEARQRAQAAEELLSRAVESISDGFAIYDADDRMVMINSRFRESFPAGAAGRRPLPRTGSQGCSSEALGSCVPVIAAGAAKVDELSFSRESHLVRGKDVGR